MVGLIVYYSRLVVCVTINVVRTGFTSSESNSHKTTFGNIYVGYLVGTNCKKRRARAAGILSSKAATKFEEGVIEQVHVNCFASRW